MASMKSEELDPLKTEPVEITEDPLEDASEADGATPIVTSSATDLRIRQDLFSETQSEAKTQNQNNFALPVPPRKAPRAPIFALNFGVFGENPLFQPSFQRVSAHINRPASEATPKPVCYSGQERKFGFDFIRKCPRHCVLILCDHCIQSLSYPLPYDFCLPDVDIYSCQVSVPADTAANTTSYFVPSFLPRKENLNSPISLTVLEPGRVHFKAFSGQSVVVEWISKLDKQMKFRLPRRDTQPLPTENQS